MTGSRSADASTIRAIASSVASRRGSWRKRSSSEYPVRLSSGKVASATPSSLQARACSMITSALRAGLAAETGSAQAATRANPCA